MFEHLDMSATYKVGLLYWSIGTVSARCHSCYTSDTAGRRIRIEPWSSQSKSISLSLSFCQFHICHITQLSWWR